MSNMPLVSCLMVSLMTPVRLNHILRAIADFRAQTYANRELVILSDRGADRATLDLVRTGIAGDDLIRLHVHEGAEKPSLGAQRNRSRRLARGDLHCVWDDDDRYHPTRLELQVQALDSSGLEALCLVQVAQFFPASRELYVTNWSATEAQAFPGSLILRADSPVCYPESGPECALGEDTHLLRQIRARGPLGVLPDQPQLYLYQSHGSNSWDDGHHAMLARTLGQSAGLLKRHEARLRQDLAWLDLGEVTVRGPGGPAFEMVLSGQA